MNEQYTSLGLMSGTSGDGVDASIIQSNGETKYDVIKDKYYEYERPISNGLENFGLQEEEGFGLFENTNETQNSLTEVEKNTEEDELEIPAFLRRQKN